MYITDPLEQESVRTDFKVESQSKDTLSSVFVSEGLHTFLLLDTTSLVFQLKYQFIQNVLFVIVALSL